MRRGGHGASAPGGVGAHLPSGTFRRATRAKVLICAQRAEEGSATSATGYTRRDLNQAGHTHLNSQRDGEVPCVAGLGERDDAEEQRGDVVRDERRRAAQHASGLHVDPRGVHQQVDDERPQQHARQPDVLHAQCRRPQLGVGIGLGGVEFGLEEHPSDVFQKGQPTLSHSVAMYM